jgi:hypothetical protein
LRQSATKTSRNSLRISRLSCFKYSIPFFSAKAVSRRKASCACILLIREDCFAVRLRDGSPLRNQSLQALLPPARAIGRNSSSVDQEPLLQRPRCIANVCWRACKSHPIIRISACFGPSSVGCTPNSLFGPSRGRRR